MRSRISGLGLRAQGLKDLWFGASGPRANGVEKVR